MNKSEQTKASEDEDGVDFISNLPDHILISILSRIPTTKEINRTSILSRRWRYLWTSVSFIDIQDFQGPKPLKLNNTKFKEFVDGVLASKSVDLDWFRLCCWDLYSMPTLGQWIHVAVTKKVKLLDLMFRPRKKSEKVELPHCLVTCSSLVELRLCLGGRGLSLPDFTGFSALRVLLLSTVRLSSVSSVKYFFENCPVLEDLSLIDCFIHELDILHVSCPKLKWLTITFKERVGYEAFYKGKGTCYSLQISCPKLVFLELRGPVATVISCKNLYSLKVARIHPEELDDDDDEEERPLIDGFTGISHVEFLSISLYLVAKCYFPTEDVPVSLPYLKTLELATDALSMDVLIPFLKCFPDLWALRLIITQVDRLEDWKLDDAATMRILTRRLKSVGFFGFDGEERKLVLARALLENGNALDIMVFFWRSQDEHHEKSLEAVKEISNFHKASSTVRFTMKYFFENCPVLENLHLVDCFIHKLDILHVSCPKLKWLTITFQERVGHEAFYKGKGTCYSLQISCPKLVYLKLTGPVARVISCKNIYSLKTAMIHPVIHPEELDDDDEGRPLIDGFTGISHVEFLSISLYFVAMCYFPTEDVPVSLPNLKALMLLTDAFSMDVLFPFLKCFPDLECLRLFITRVDRLEDWKLDDVAAMRILTRRLKAVHFLDFDGEERKLALARALLENGNALDEMIFVWYSQDEHHDKSLEAMTKISKFHKASSTVKFTSVIESARS